MEGTIAIEEDELGILALKENEEADRTVPCVPANTRACLKIHSGTAGRPTSRHICPQIRPT